MFVQPLAKLIYPLRTNRDSGRMRMTTKLLKQIRARSQPMQQVIRFNASSGAMGHAAVNRQHDTRSIQPLSNLRRGDSDHAAMPALARDHRNVRVLSLLYLRDREIDDLLLHYLPLFVASVKMVCEPPCFLGIARIKELDDCARRIHASGGVDAWSESKSEIVCCHALAVSATGDAHQRF